MFDRRPHDRPGSAEELSNLLRSGALGGRLIDAARHGVAGQAPPEPVSRRIVGAGLDADRVRARVARRAVG